MVAVMSHAGGPPALPAIIFRSGRWFEEIAGSVDGSSATWRNEA